MATAKLLLDEASAARDMLLRHAWHVLHSSLVTVIVSKAACNKSPLVPAKRSVQKS